MITGRSDRDMYINARNQVGKYGFMNTWQLTERHNRKGKPVKINIDNVVMIKRNDKNRGK